MSLGRILVPVICVGLGAVAGHALSKNDAPKPAPTIANLLTQPLDPAFTADREVIVDLVDIPPNTTLERHWHPGEEFHYYLEGDPQVTIDGRDTIVGKPGTIGHIPFRARHVASAGQKGAKVLVFRVHTTGEPVRVNEPETRKP
jgi:quercetin dioxygenase-like cupin family protein